MSSDTAFETWFSATESSIPIRGIQAVLKLQGEGATVPFMARYRKEQTGNLDEVQIQKILDGKEKWDELLKRKAFVLSEIEEQKKLTPELKAQIENTFDPDLLEDLYLPYKRKRKTKAALAKEAGIQPFADWIWNCAHGTETPQPGQTLELWAFTFRNEEKEFTTPERVIEGAEHILIERISEMQHLRQMVRDAVFQKGFVSSQKAKGAKQHSKFEPYFEYQETVKSLQQPQNSHRYLALKRGQMEEELTIAVGAEPKDTLFEEGLLKAFHKEAASETESPGKDVLRKAAHLAYKAHVFPSIESEAHRALKEVADGVAIQVFSENLKKLLLASPFGAKAVLGVDPGLRTGCKLAVVDQNGKYIASTVLHLQTDEEKAKAKPGVSELIQSGNIQAIAVGNGTAGRQTETFFRQAVNEAKLNVPVVMVSESGASVYSASEAAREEFPDLDLTVRGAISIARRLQDPLAELVKVDPKSIGVGQYQHDVSARNLKKGLDFVVENCVNSVGVNLNTASYHLLSYVSGIGPEIAKAVVSHRQEKGLFKSRQDLLEVPRFGAKAFEQAAGFLRINGAENVLDNTGVHPERYPQLEKVAERLGKKTGEFIGTGVALLKEDKAFQEEVGPFTFQDIIQELEKPGRDPREDFVPFHFREDIYELKDLTVGLQCPGIVTNVTNFGAFVDIGVHQDGLVHISQLSDQFVKDPRAVVSPGDRVQVRVIEVNLEKNQIALSMKRPQEERAARPPRDRRPNGPRGDNRRSQQARPPRPERPKFTNNPFASALAHLKDKK